MRFREMRLQVGAKLTLYLRFPGVLYSHASPHSAFFNLLNFLVEFLPVCMMSVISYCHVLPQVSKYRYPISAWRCMSLLRIKISWLPWDFWTVSDEFKNSFVDYLAFSCHKDGNEAFFLLRRHQKSSGLTPEFLKMLNRLIPFVSFIGYYEWILYIRSSVI